MRTHVGATKPSQCIEPTTRHCQQQNGNANSSHDFDRASLSIVSPRKATITGATQKKASANDRL